MRCLSCATSSDGFAVIPGIGEYGEIRFFCDPCARRERVKLRYWDGRDLDVGGYRESPELGASFATLIFSFEDVARMRREDIAVLLEWVEDDELGPAMRQASNRLQQRLFECLKPDRAQRLRERYLRRDGEGDPQSAQTRIVQILRKL